MHLIYCCNCEDMFNPHARSVCACGNTTTTINDGIIVYRGLYAVPVELGDRSMTASLEFYKKYGVMTRFSGWFPAESSFFKKGE